MKYNEMRIPLPALGQDHIYFYVVKGASLIPGIFENTTQTPSLDKNT